MRVLMYCLSSVSGGAVSYLRNLVPLLVNQFEEAPESHKLQILAHEDQRELFDSVPDAQYYWVTGQRPTGWRRIVWEWRNMARIVRETDADVLFVPYQIGPRVRGVKQVMMIRNMEPFLFRNYRYSPYSLMRNHILYRQSSRALRGADRIIAVSGFAEEQLRSGLGISEELIRKVYHGRDTAFSPEGDLSDDQDCLRSIGVEGNFLLTCGSFLPYRRYEDVIATFNKCANDLSPDVKLVIAGSGSDARYTETIRQAISNSPFRSRIITVGHVSKRAMIALYRRCLICIIATEIEACPNIAIEAMSSGCTIISSDRPPLPEIFQDASMQYPSRDVKELAATIKSCLKDDKLRIEKSKRALRRAQDFSWEKCAIETYSALVDW